MNQQDQFIQDIVSTNKNEVTQAIGIANKRLTSLPKNICNLPRLAWLQLENNQLKSILPSTDNLQILETLVLTKNRLSSLPDTLQKLTSLQTLHLEQNKFSRATVEQMKAWLPHCAVLA